MIGVIVNPNAHRNRRRPDKARVLQTLVQHHGRVLQTATPDEIPRAVQRLYDEGCRWMVADGGDGSLHWLLHHAIEQLGVDVVQHELKWVAGNGGTINYVAQVTGVKTDTDGVVRALVASCGTRTPPRTEVLPSLSFVGQLTDGGVLARTGFGFALAGFGANVFGPFYRSRLGRGPARIAGIISQAFGAAIGRSLLVGPMSKLKTQGMLQAEYDYLRALPARVWRDGQVFCDQDGVPIERFTAMNAAAIPINLGGLLRVFPRAYEAAMHVHLGDVSAAEMARMMPAFMRGAEDLNSFLSRAYDGPATSLEVDVMAGATMDPVMDGELYADVVHAMVSAGPPLTFLRPSDALVGA